MKARELSERILSQIKNRQEALNQIAEQFAEAEYQLLLLFQIFPDLIIIANLEGKIIKASSSVKPILEYCPSEVVDRSILEFVAEEDKEKTQQFFDQMIGQESYISNEVNKGFINQWVTKSGQRKKLLWRVHAFNKEQKILVGIATNITSLEFTDFDNANLLYAAIEHLANGVVITDNTQPDNPIIYANPVFLKICGYTLQEVLGKNCRFLQDPQCQGSVVKNKLKEALNAGIQHQCILKNRTKNNEVFFNYLTVIPIIKNNVITNYIGITNDVTSDVLIGKYKWDPSYPVGYLSRD